MKRHATSATRSEVRMKIVASATRGRVIVGRWVRRFYRSWIAQPGAGWQQTSQRVVRPYFVQTPEPVVGTVSGSSVLSGDVRGQRLHCNAVNRLITLPVIE